MGDTEACTASVHTIDMNTTRFVEKELSLSSRRFPFAQLTWTASNTLWDSY